MSNALFNFTAKDVSASRVISLGGRVHDKMTDNDFFPNANPLNVVLGTKLKAFVSAEAVASNGSSADKLLARMAKTELQDAMKEMCRHVNTTTTDRVALLTTGFDLNKERPVRIVLEPVTNFKVAAGTGSGTLKASFRRPAGMQAGGFEWVYGEAGSGEVNWFIVTTGNRCSVSFTGLTPGNVVTIRGFAEGARGQKVYSQAIVTVAGFNKTAKTA